jgi:hypothetical protein
MMHFVTRSHVFLTTWTLLAVSTSALAGDEKSEGGIPASGLRLRLEVTSARKGANFPRYCAVTIENVGEADRNVKLGFSLNNGESHHPQAFRFILTAKGEKPRTLIYFDGLPGVGGRADPMVVPLPARAGYTLRFALDSLVTPKTLEKVDLAAKDYRLAAELTGTSISAKEVNLDTMGQVSIACWEGKALSNQVRLSAIGPHQR